MVYLHDDYGYFLHEDRAFAVTYFGAAAALATLIGLVMRRTRREIIAVALATVPACIGVVVAAFLLAVATHGIPET
jgi:hypothetical protein